MKYTLLLLPLALLSACSNSTIRQYTVLPADGLTSPYTPQCQALRITAGSLVMTAEPNNLPSQTLSVPNPGATSITAECLVSNDGAYTVTGSSTVSASSRALNVAVGSSEGSSQADAFAKTARVSGVFPIIRVH